MQQGNRIVLVVPVGPVRVDASDRAELCTQALAGELAVVLNTGPKDWVHIQLESGWLHRVGWTASNGRVQRMIPVIRSFCKRRFLLGCVVMVP